MTHYHMVHLIPTERHHGLYGYTEVIQTLTWGLTTLGHTVTYAKNSYINDATNIVFGHQIAGKEILSMMPAGTIIYNLEQLARFTKEDATDESRFSFDYSAKNFEIWDYSEDNIALWSKLETKFPVSKVPIGYAPILTRIPKAEPQDIDVLIYGHPNDNRIEIFRRLCSQGLRVVFLFGFYGDARDALIARSKIVLNIGQHDKTFEIVRASYLMANRKAVVADIYENISIESDIANGIMFTNFDFVLPACLHLLQHDDARQNLEEAGFQSIQKRDIVRILTATLNGSMTIT